MGRARGSDHHTSVLCETHAGDGGESICAERVAWHMRRADEPSCLKRSIGPRRVRLYIGIRVCAAGRCHQKAAGRAVSSVVSCHTVRARAFADRTVIAPEVRASCGLRSWSARARARWRARAHAVRCRVRACASESYRPGSARDECAPCRLRLRAARQAVSVERVVCVILTPRLVILKSCCLAVWFVLTLPSLFVFPIFLSDSAFFPLSGRVKSKE